MQYNDEQVTMIRDDDILLYYIGAMMTKENVIPCRDYVLIKVQKSQMETKSGIVVAETTMKDLEKCEGTVFKVGEGRMSSEGELTAAPLEVGDFVKFKDYAGNDVRIEGEDYALVKMVDILCALKDDADMLTEVPVVLS
jgi:chaperonin GroES